MLHLSVMRRPPLLLLSVTVSFAGAMLSIIEGCSDDELASAGSPDASATPTDADASSTADGEVTTTGPFYKSGTRLRAQVHRAGDAKIFDSMVDTQRDETCSFSEVEGGEWRCIPTGTEIVFADDACTSPLALVSTCSTQRKVAARFENSACHSFVKEVREIGAPTGGATYHVYSPSSGCQPESTVSPDQTLHAVSAPLPFATFVGATKLEEPVGTTLRRQRLRGEDGSELALASDMLDVAAQRVCAPRFVKEEGACTPQFSVFAGGDNDFGDSNCSMRAGAVTASSKCGGQPTIGQSLDRVDGSAGCGTSYALSFWQLGPSVDGGFFKGNGMCTPRAGEYAPFTSQLPLSTFAPTPPALYGSGPIVQRALSVGSVIVERGSFYDSRAKAQCVELPFMGNKLFCVPPYLANPEVFFKDAACTQRVVYSPMCGSTPEVAVTGSVSCTSGYDVDVMPLGPLIEVTEVFSNTSGTCAPLSTGPAQVHDVLPTVPVGSKFTEIVVERE